MPTGGQLVAEALRAHQVDRVFCVPGESYLALLDGLYDHREVLSVISCRHEHGAAVMAEASGKLTGHPGVVMVTRGPGACNAAIGVHTAFQDSAPMLVLIGQVPRRHLGREAFQEVDLVRMFAPLAKQTIQVASPEALPDSIAQAFKTALSGRKGPVVLVLPEDILSAETTASGTSPMAAERQEPDPKLMAEVRDRLGKATRPLMIVGGSGWNDTARADIVAFATANNIPVCCSFRRLDIFDNGHANFIGELGFGPDPALLARVQKADLLIAVGTRLGDIPTQSYTLIEPTRAHAPLIHVHPDPAELGRVFDPVLAIAVDMTSFAAAARSLAPTDDETRRQWLSDARGDYMNNRVIPPSNAALDLGHVMQFLDEWLPDNAVVTVDAGNFSGWPQRFIRFGGRRRLLGAANGAMGYGVPAAIAVKLREPARMVLACTGDGGFGMTGQEMSTAVGHNAAPIILVFNNGMYGTIRMHQERSFPRRVIATDLHNPDFAALARAYGAHGESVARTEDFLPAFDRALASGTAAVIELKMDPEIITTRTTLSAIGNR
ncbi:MAG: thiamine pyrophosphate-binding protein [Rhodospirillales bacterium]|nr:thiamine pyrophosphate-binding protein [Rhodospirillales bacterium]